MPRLGNFASTPPLHPSWWRHIRENDHSRKCPGDLIKFPALNPGGKFRICKSLPHPTPWWRHIREFLDLVNMKEYVENMTEYLKNTKKYVENMKGYEEIIYRYIGFSIYMGLGAWKNSTPKLPPWLWDLENFWASPRIGSGTWKNFELHLI